jgi:hypothetical protein
VAETEDKFTPPGISLLAAHDLVTKLLLSVSYAWPQLLKWLQQGKLRWTYMGVYGVPRQGRTLRQEASLLWQNPLRLTVSRTESLALKPSRVDSSGRVVCQITVIGIRISPRRCQVHRFSLVVPEAGAVGVRTRILLALRAPDGVIAPAREGWQAAALGLVAPRFPLTSDSLTVAIAIFGTTIKPLI